MNAYPRAFYISVSVVPSCADLHPIYRQDTYAMRGLKYFMNSTKRRMLFNDQCRFFFIEIRIECIDMILCK